MVEIQQTPQAPSYTAPGIQVPANIASPEATMNSVKDQQGQLNAVNNLTSGGGRRHTRGKSQTQQKGGGAGACADVGVRRLFVHTRVADTRAGVMQHLSQYPKSVQHAQAVLNAPVRKMQH